MLSLPLLQLLCVSLAFDQGVSCCWPDSCLCVAGFLFVRAERVKAKNRNKMK